jgi:hypothetical protein
MNAPHTLAALVIPTGEQPAYLSAIAPTLDAMQELVGGDIEALSIAADAVMYLNEVGKYAGLPVNANANKVVYLANPGLMPNDYIVGQVVLVGTLNAEGTFDGDDYPVPQSVLDLCRRAGVAVQMSN